MTTKIKILKDIPGYKAGTYELNDKGRLDCSENWASYEPARLYQEGFAEEVKDQIHIEEIRSKYLNVFGVIEVGIGEKVKYNILTHFITREDWTWFRSYRIVKAVIEKLNGEWVKESKKRIWLIKLDEDTNTLEVDDWYYRHSPLPLMKDKETAKKVIELCKPELEILFGVK